MANCINIYGYCDFESDIDKDLKNYINTLNENDKIEKPTSSCHWYINSENYLVWDQNHNFKEPIRWLHLITRIMNIKNIMMNGILMFRDDDTGKRFIVNVSHNHILKVR